jgi:hypothetical protein
MTSETKSSRVSTSFRRSALISMSSARSPIGGKVGGYNTIEILGRLDVLGRLGLGSPHSVEDVLTCPRCRTANPPRSKFCLECIAANEA